MAAAAVALALAACLASGAQGLVCYDNDERGVVSLLNSTAFDYCVASPHSFEPVTKMETFGVTVKQDMVETYDQLFGLSEQNIDAAYTVLSMCLFEKYTLGPMEEYAFRCLCKTDKCNRGDGLGSFLKHVKTQERNAELKKLRSNKSFLP